MAPMDIDTALEWRGRTVVDRDGERIGKLEELYLDESDRPAWAAVATGLFGRRQSLVPLADLRPAGDDLQVPYEKDRVKDAPNVDPDDQVSAEEEARLHRHYGVATEPDPEPEAREAVDDMAGREDVAGGDPRDGGDGAEMIRSEEEVDVSTRRRVRGKARLKKYVVTEHVQKVVPVQREEVRVEFEPADGEPGKGEPADVEGTEADATAPDARRTEAVEERPRE